MTASELHRKLLYCGYPDLTDYLRTNFNRCVYNVLLDYGPKPLEVPMLTIFNEAYYLCVRVNFESDPGNELVSRYLSEETEWLHSEKSAHLVLSVVWGILRCKNPQTFSEQCFVDQSYPLLDRGRDERFAYILIKFTAIIGSSGGRIDCTFLCHKLNPLN